MPTRPGLHGLYVPRFTAGATKWASNYEARSINADTLAALDRLAGYPAYCRILSILRS